MKFLLLLVLLLVLAIIIIIIIIIIVIIKTGWVPLMLTHDKQIVKFLLEHGADPLLQDNVRN